ncbi:MAG: UvrD-helicase domain-containing protein [Saccharofermentans sp.]|nr:UvrD-helicase domain-containing protein [Saccharofermentans sp.]
MEPNSSENEFFSEMESIYGASSSYVTDASELLSGLNAEQEAAVTHLNGPLLILAGAGSGKTRVITYRIAYMMRKHNVRPSNILAITFTNKAAREMRERIESLVGDEARFIWCGTFHSIFAKILRKHAELIGFNSNFMIVDSDDQLKLIRDSMKELDIPESRFKPRSILSEISKAKNKLMGVEAFTKYAGGDYFLSSCAKVYKRYMEKLAANNAMDFDDILVNIVKLFKADPEVLESYRERFRYIMVDEYQDTNTPQYEAVMLLASSHKNICVVGDDDQSIYSFRGADVKLILSFEKDFPGCKVIKLEENYRSTQTILDAANCVIAHNTKRKSKTLRTSGAKGDRIILMNSDSGQDEARFVAQTIKMMTEKGKFRYKDCAVLYRMNALSRSIESTLSSFGIPFKVYGGLRFYDRKEIKDILCYLRLISDTADNISFERIINVPKRGIGDTTVDKIRQIAIEENTDLYTIARNADAYPDLARSANRLFDFTELIERMRATLLAGDMDFMHFVDYVENESGVIDEIVQQREKKGEIVDRVENLKELLSEAAEFDKEHRGEPSEGGDEFIDTSTADTTEGILRIYLENAALVTEGDNFDESDDFVKLMTIHSAKGLEFGAVFLIGCEEGVFPGYRAMESESEVEEERRLMYVAITRAKKNLFLVLSRQRLLFGNTQCNRPSRFISEINKELLYPMGRQRQEAKPTESPSRREESRKTISASLASQFDRKPKKVEGALTSGEVTEGMMVSHPRFGEGKILRVELAGGDALVTIDFDGMRKNMLVNASGLKRI